MKKVILNFLLFTFLPLTYTHLSAQTTFYPQMINSTGGSGVVNTTYYDFTVGEPFVDFGGTSCDSIYAGFQYCSEDTLDVKKVTVTPNGPTNFCLNGSVILSAPAGGTSYLWNTTATTQTISATQTGNYSVRIINSCNDTIYSNVISVTTVDPQIPAICLVSTDSSSINNVIYWEKTSVTHADSFIIYREVSTNIYSRVGAVSKDSLSLFVDANRSIGPANGDPNSATYRYKIQLRDSCGNYSDINQSKYHNSVHVTDNSGTFSWNTYDVQGQVTPVLNFYLKVDTNNTGYWKTRAICAGTQTTLIDANYFNYNTVANWRIDATGFNCTPTLRYGNNSTEGTIVRTRSNVKNNRTTGIQKSESIFSMYPNPSDDELTITLSKNCNDCQVQITNVLGQGMKSISISGAETRISLTDLQSGVYLVKITGNGNSSKQKLVIQH